MRLASMLLGLLAHAGPLAPGRTYSLREVLLEAVRQQQQGNIDAAVQLYQEVLQVQPLNPDALHLLGVVAHSKGDYSEAEQLVKRAIAQRPSMAQCHNNLGEVYRQQDRFDEALACYTAAISIEPSDPGAHFNKGLLYASLGQLDAAIAAYQAALSCNGAYSAAIEQLGERKNCTFQLTKCSGCPSSQHLRSVLRAATMTPCLCIKRSQR